MVKKDCQPKGGKIRFVTRDWPKPIPQGKLVLWFIASGCHSVLSLGVWVLNNVNDSSANFANNCANNCANNVRNNSDFRAAVLASP